MNDSDYLKWRRRLNLRTSAEQDAKCLDAEQRGLKFMVDFGIDTDRRTIRSIEQAKEIDRLMAKRRAS